MKLKNSLAWMVPVSVIVLLFAGPTNSLATEGGQVGQDAVIEFYADELPPTDSSSEGSTSATSSSEQVVAKPIGKLPNTGEVVKKSLVLSGASLVIIGIVFMVAKRRKQKEEQEDEKTN